MMDSTTEHLTKAFNNAVAGVTAVIDFWAAWCWPCRAMGEQFERAAKLRPKYWFAKVDVDAEPALAVRYAIRSIPTVMVLGDRRPIAAQSGVIGPTRRSTRPPCGSDRRPDAQAGGGVMKSDRRWPLERWLFVLVGARWAPVLLRRACWLRSAIYDDGNGALLSLKVMGA